MLLFFIKRFYFFIFRSLGLKGRSLFTNVAGLLSLYLRYINPYFCEVCSLVHELPAFLPYFLIMSMRVIYLFDNDSDLINRT